MVNFIKRLGEPVNDQKQLNILARIQQSSITYCEETNVSLSLLESEWRPSRRSDGFVTVF